MKEIGVAILGLGTVGGGTYEILVKNRQFFMDTESLDVTVQSVLDLNSARLAALGVPKSIIAKDLAEVVSNDAVDIVVETIGGVGFAKEAITKCLMCGKTVVTANKELVAKHWKELEAIAKTHNAGLYFEASCVGGVPIIRALTDGLQANHIQSIYGIINGTTNYILTKMSDEGMSYDAALKEAQSLGYAEANPSADVDGFDAAYKLTILSSLAFHKQIKLSDVYREGISDIKKEDIAFGKRFGYVLKLLAIGKQTEEGIELRVHPTFLSVDDPLSTTGGSFNAVHVVGDSVGDIMLYGRGAGALPTGSAIVSDVIYGAKRLDCHHEYRRFMYKQTGEDFTICNDFTTSYYIRINAADKAGVLARVGGIFAEADVSIREVIQSSEAKNGVVPLVITSHQTRESKMKRALELFERNEDTEVCTVIRIE